MDYKKEIQEQEDEFYFIEEDNGEPPVMVRRNPKYKKPEGFVGKWDYVFDKKEVKGDDE